MGQPLGQLKVTIVQGKRLVIRDFKSSDPYVIVKLGNQTAKTKVINSCLNPVWNEELSFTLTEPVGVLHLFWSGLCHAVNMLNSMGYSLYLIPVARSDNYDKFLWHLTKFRFSQEVFDKDRFKADDKMGHATLNLQPIVSAARLRHVVRLSSGETPLRKIVADSDNCLARESSISCINGEVVQNAWLRLCDVESGEIELTLRLIDPPVVPPIQYCTVAP
ncbi:hypothetical protein Patl1_09601 [Pistacia atlantica]|uniref:Uncharacterized protein n=1 Tax=Pistacia atlantica TaxID=434234 RepID=A0ACC1A6E2_9ROSI|nr:hypothetical protein Patl1_09601 [Pistacia atlantica]